MSRVMSSDVSTSLVLLPIFLIIFVVLEDWLRLQTFTTLEAKKGPKDSSLNSY